MAASISAAKTGPGCAQGRACGAAVVTRRRSSERMRLGMTYMSELAVFPDLSIEENIRIGAQALGHADSSARVEEMYGVFPALREKRRAPASDRKSTRL